MALHILREWGDHEGEARLLTRLGSLSLTMGDTAKAGLYMQQSLAAMDTEGGDDPAQASELRFNAVPDLPGVLIAQPVGHFKLDDYIARVVSLSRLLGKDTLADTTEQAADWLREAAKDANMLKSSVTLSLEHELIERQQKGDRSGEADTLSQLGMAYGMSGDLPAALSYLEPAGVIYRELGKPQALAANLDYRAVLYSEQGDHARAISNGEEALALYLQLEDEEGQSEALVHLGEAQLTSGAPAQATPYFARAAELLAELDDPEGVAYSFYRLGECYQQIGQPQEAQGVLNQALKAAAMLSDKETRVKILASMIGISQELLDWEGVITYGEQALASLSPDDSAQKGPILISLGEAYIYKGT